MPVMCCSPWTKSFPFSFCLVSYVLASGLQGFLVCQSAVVGFGGFCGGFFRLFCFCGAGFCFGFLGEGVSAQEYLLARLKIIIA